MFRDIFEDNTDYKTSVIRCAPPQSTPEIQGLGQVWGKGWGNQGKGREDSKFSCVVRRYSLYTQKNLQ